MIKNLSKNYLVYTGLTILVTISAYLLKMDSKVVYVLSFISGMIQILFLVDRVSVKILAGTLFFETFIGTVTTTMKNSTLLAQKFAVVVFMVAVVGGILTTLVVFLIIRWIKKKFKNPVKIWVIVNLVYLAIFFILFKATETIPGERLMTYNAIVWLITLPIILKNWDSKTKE